MSLITMGWGHLTVITMGLGTSFRLNIPTVIPQQGKVSFENLTKETTFTDTSKETNFQDGSKSTTINEVSK